MDLLFAPIVYYAGLTSGMHRTALKNQIEGNMLQSLSRALKEEVRFDGSRITSVDWGTYPILTFSDAPEMDRPHQQALGAGDAVRRHYCKISTGSLNTVYLKFIQKSCEVFAQSTQVLFSKCSKKI